MESARLTYEYNKTNYERDKKLHDKQLISDYEFQTSAKDYEVSKTSYDKARADRVRAAKESELCRNILAYRRCCDFA